MFPPISLPFRRGAAPRPGPFFAALLFSAVVRGAVPGDPLDAALRAARRACRENAGSAAEFDRLAALELRGYRADHAAETLAAAREAVERALALSPADFDARRFRAAIHLVEHRFAEVEREAGELHAERPADADVLGMIADARMESGKYAEAEVAIQEMVDLRPGLPAYSRVSYAREIGGALGGALRAMDMAIAAGNPADPESLAWCVARSGVLCWKLGRVDEAAQRFERARDLYPRSPYAWEGIGWTAAARGDTDAAAKAFEKAFEIVPWPQYAVEREELAESVGNDGDAKRWKSIVGAIERMSSGAGLFNRVLALWEADHGDPARGVEMARSELEARRDVYGWDAYAWTLFRAGRVAEAAGAARRAIARGTEDPALEARAGIVLASAGAPRDARRLLLAALRTNPRFSLSLADEARRALDRLDGARPDEQSVGPVPAEGGGR